ncbi:phosphotransferase enzyme family protein [Steroidobacter sp.]|uniref:phosphotransferase enzyme family protein n=1 Tax=Steroidobacter sp. TaxID=1978227 RepID=UPI001A4EB8B6|nr:phosphotransferase [Steroidobacter sp.]MBL8268442.1 phosphotransferase [Steroidobacter sp.]
MATDFYSLTDAEQIQRLTALATAALAHWPGDFGAPVLIKYRENAVFSVTRSDGTCAALRVHRHAYHSDAALHSELFWMSELARVGMQVPPIVPTAAGGLFVHVGAPGVPEKRQVDMLGWLSGKPIGSAESGLSLEEGVSERLYHSAGRLAAQLHNHSTAMTLPSAFTRHSWCEQGLLSDAPLWGRFWELAALSPEERAVLTEARFKAAEDLAALGKSSAAFGMIHADFVPENLLNDGGRLQLIDFDDAGFGWHMFELATALYWTLDEPNYPSICRALFDGYRSERPLSPAHEAMLPLFLFLRGSTYLGWLQTRAETQTARELGPLLIERTCRLARRYLAAH